MVCGPASSPCPASSFRSRVISSTVSGLIADGEVFGRRTRGLERRLALGLVAGQQRADPRPRDPVRAGHLTDRAFSTVMAVMTSRALDIPAANRSYLPDPGRHAGPAVLDVLRHPVLDVLNLDTTPATTSETAPWLRKRGPAGRFLLVTMCISTCHYGSMHGSVRVHMVYSARVELAVRITARCADPRPFCPLTPAPGRSPDCYPRRISRLAL